MIWMRHFPTLMDNPGTRILVGQLRSTAHDTLKNGKSGPSLGFFHKRVTGVLRECGFLPCGPDAPRSWPACTHSEAATPDKVLKNGTVAAPNTFRNWRQRQSALRVNSASHLASTTGSPTSSTVRRSQCGESRPRLLALILAGDEAYGGGSTFESRHNAGRTLGR
jgi:hypothetical protein